MIAVLEMSLSGSVPSTECGLKSGRPTGVGVGSGVGVGVGCTVTAGISAVSSSALFAAMPRITTMTSTAMSATNITMPTTVLAVIFFSSISLSTLFYRYSVK